MPSRKKAVSIPEEHSALMTSVNPRVDFVRSVKFVGIGLDQTAASVSRSLLAQAHESDQTFEIDVKIKQSVLVHEPDFFVVQADFSLMLRAKESEQDIVSIGAIFSARFNLSKPAPEELVKGFAQLEAKLIFFPYLRQYVSDLSYRMSIDPIVLPLTSELEG